MIFNNIKNLLRKAQKKQLVISAAGDTDVGIVRSNNEDCIVLRQGLGLFVVCDGMGGHRGGEQASRSATETIVEQIEKGESLKNSILAAHRAICSLDLAQDGEKEHKGKPGSTVVALVTTASSWQVGWVGDSRCWMLSDTTEIEQITVDHTVVQQMVTWGDITPEEARSHPDRNRLSQALGTGEHEPQVGLREGKLQSDMIILLATDGMAMWNEPQQLGAILDTQPPSESVQQLIEASLAAGGHDNVSCIVVQCQEGRK